MQLWAHGLLQEPMFFYVCWSAQLLKPYKKKKLYQMSGFKIYGFQHSFILLNLSVFAIRWHV